MSGGGGSAIDRLIHDFLDRIQPEAKDKKRAIGNFSKELSQVAQAARATSAGTTEFSGSSSSHATLSSLSSSTSSGIVHQQAALLLLEGDARRRGLLHACGLRVASSDDVKRSAIMALALLVDLLGIGYGADHVTLQNDIFRSIFINLDPSRLLEMRLDRHIMQGYQRSRGKKQRANAGGAGDNKVHHMKHIHSVHKHHLQGHSSAVKKAAAAAAAVAALSSSSSTANMSSKRLAAAASAAAAKSAPNGCENAFAVMDLLRNKRNDLKAESYCPDIAARRLFISFLGARGSMGSTGSGTVQAANSMERMRILSVFSMGQVDENSRSMVGSLFEDDDGGGEGHGKWLDELEAADQSSTASVWTDVDAVTDNAWIDSLHAQHGSFFSGDSATGTEDGAAVGGAGIGSSTNTTGGSVGVAAASGTGSGSQTRGRSGARRAGAESVVMDPLGLLSPAEAQRLYRNFVLSRTTTTLPMEGPRTTSGGRPGERDGHSASGGGNEGSSKGTFDEKRFLRILYGKQPMERLRAGEQQLESHIMSHQSDLKNLVRQHLDIFVECKEMTDEIHEKVRKKKREEDLGDLIKGYREIEKQTNDIFDPILRARIAQAKTRRVLSNLHRLKHLLDVPHRMQDAIGRGDGERVVSEYRRVKQGKLAASVPPRILARVLSQTDEIVLRLEQSLCARLRDDDAAGIAGRLTCVRQLIELDCRQDPAWLCLTSLTDATNERLSAVVSALVLRVRTVAASSSNLASAANSFLSNSSSTFGGEISVPIAHQTARGLHGAAPATSRPSGTHGDSFPQGRRSVFLSGSRSEVNDLGDGLTMGATSAGGSGLASAAGGLAVKQDVLVASAIEDAVEIFAAAVAAFQAIAHLYQTGELRRVEPQLRRYASIEWAPRSSVDIQDLLRAMTAHFCGCMRRIINASDTRRRRLSSSFRRSSRHGSSAAATMAVAAAAAATSTPRDSSARSLTRSVSLDGAANVSVANGGIGGGGATVRASDSVGANSMATPSEPEIGSESGGSSGTSNSLVRLNVRCVYAGIAALQLPWLSRRLANLRVARETAAPVRALADEIMNSYLGTVRLSVCANIRRLGDVFFARVATDAYANAAAAVANGSAVGEANDESVTAAVAGSGGMGSGGPVSVTTVGSGGMGGGFGGGDGGDSITGSVGLGVSSMWGFAGRRGAAASGPAGRGMRAWGAGVRRGGTFGGGVGGGTGVKTFREDLVWELRGGLGVYLHLVDRVLGAGSGGGGSLALAATVYRSFGLCLQTAVEAATRFGTEVTSRQQEAGGARTTATIPRKRDVASYGGSSVDDLPSLLRGDSSKGSTLRSGGGSVAERGPQLQMQNPDDPQSQAVPLAFSMRHSPVPGPWAGGDTTEAFAGEVSDAVEAESMERQEAAVLLASIHNLTIFMTVVVPDLWARLRTCLNTVASSRASGSSACDDSAGGSGSGGKMRGARSGFDVGAQRHGGISSHGIAEATASTSGITDGEAVYKDVHERAQRLESHLVASYVGLKAQAIARTARGGLLLGGYDWVRDTGGRVYKGVASQGVGGEAGGVRSWAMLALNEIASVHEEMRALRRPQLTQHVCEELVACLLQSVVRVLRRIDLVGPAAASRLRVDLRFILESAAGFTARCGPRVCEIEEVIGKFIGDSSEGNTAGSPTDDDMAEDILVRDALRKTRLQFVSLAVATN